MVIQLTCKNQAWTQRNRLILIWSIQEQSLYFYASQSSPLAMINNPFLCFLPYLLVSPSLSRGHKDFPVQAFIQKGKECRVLSAAGFKRSWTKGLEPVLTSNPVWQVSGPKWTFLSSVSFLALTKWIWICLCFFSTQRIIKIQLSMIMYVLHGHLFINNCFQDNYVLALDFQLGFYSSSSRFFVARLESTVLVDCMLKQDYNSSVDLCFLCLLGREIRTF